MIDVTFTPPRLLSNDDGRSFAQAARAAAAQQRTSRRRTQGRLQCAPPPGSTLAARITSLVPTILLDVGVIILS